MNDIAGWVAPAATMIAAMMTAANLGARVTGWGFVVFTVGSIAWIVVALATGQTNLLAANGFLTFVNLIGIWRWLGRRAKFDDAAQAAGEASHHSRGSDLFAVSHLDGMAVTDRGGETVAHAVDAMTECSGGAIAFLIVRIGGVVGVGEELRRLPWRRARMTRDAIATDLARADFDALARAEA